jgi:hypothetical protein
MFAAIEHFGTIAVLANGVWSSDEPSFDKLLNSMLPEDGQSGADPQPDITEAHRVAGLLGAKVVKEEADEHTKGRVY